MSINLEIKERAISLRKQGRTYSEILKKIHVAKSTLALWLQSVELSKKQRQKITEKRMVAAKRGGGIKRQQRIDKKTLIHRESFKQLSHVSDRELWLIGTALYWAEGTKEKEYYPGTGISFNNSDSRMIQVFIKWLLGPCEVDKDRIKLEVYLHQSGKNNLQKVREYWSNVTGFPIAKIAKVYFKKNKIHTNRRNVDDLYYGLLRVKVSASSELLRRVSGWTEAIVERVL